MSKPNKDGWIRHRGGKCSVEKGVLIDVRYRCGEVNIGVTALMRSNEDGFKSGGHYYALAIDWSHDGSPGDIMAWKLHKPEQVEPSADGYTYRTLEEWTKIRQEKAQSIIDNTSAKVKEIGNHMLEAVADIIDHANPIQWRDRIREIESTVEALEEERVSLVQKLEAEGFRLIEPVKAEPAEDMSDWRNWKKGDFVQSVSDQTDDKSIVIGGIYELTDKPEELCLYLIDGDKDYRNRIPRKYKWHSRPSA